MLSRFRRYELRTLDVDGARQFYSRLLGHDRAVVWPLHEQARARGAVPHWLGSVGVEDTGRLESISGQFVERGATRLGPTLATREGCQAAVLRDPGGAIVGVTTEPASGSVEVVWHVLNTADLGQAMRNYRDLIGWDIAESSLPGPDGIFHEFGWGPGEERNAGVIADIAGRPGIHPHWLFFFPVARLDAAVEHTLGAGGTATDPLPGPSDRRISICEDPQRAAFGLVEQSS